VYKIKENVTLKNIFSTSVHTGDIIDEQDIEGKTFYVMRSNNKVFKLAKEAHIIRKNND